MLRQNDMLIRILLAVFMMESIESTVTLRVEREAIHHLLWHRILLLISAAMVQAMVAALGGVKDYSMKVYLLFAEKLQVKSKVKMSLSSDII